MSTSLITLPSSSSSSSSSVDETQRLTVVALLPEQFQSRLVPLLPTLSSLILTNCGLDISHAKFLGEILSQNTTILILDLSLNRLTSQGGKAIMAGLMSNSTLTSLNLSDCFLAAPFGKSCASLLTSNTTLRSLKLSKNALKLGGQEIITSLTSNMTLNELDLSECGLNAPIVHSILVMLITNTSLRSLHLNDNNFGSTETVGQHFATAIQTNQTLETLSLCNTRLGANARQLILTATNSLLQVQLSPTVVLPTPQRRLFLLPKRSPLMIRHRQHDPSPKRPCHHSSLGREMRPTYYY